MKHTLIETLHDADQHAYVVTIGTDMGQFTGAVQCREEDYGNESRYFGFELAEIKAEIEYARAQRNHWDARAKALSEFWKDMSQTRTYDIDAFWVKKMRVTLDNAMHKKTYWADQVEALQVAYYEKIKGFDLANSKRKSFREV